MRIAPNQAAITPPPAPSAPPPPAIRAEGQVLAAEVVAQIDNLQYRLQTPLGEKLITSKVPLQLGEKLALEVVGDLKSKTLIADKGPANVSPQQAAAEQIRNLLPKQTDAARLMALLPVLTQQAQAPEAISKLLALMPSPDDLQNPARLKKEINRSGFFYEAKLAQGQVASAATDTKGLLLNLLKALPEMAQESRLSPAPSTNAAKASAALAVATPVVLPQISEGLSRQAKISGELLSLAMPNTAPNQLKPILQQLSDAPALAKPLQHLAQLLSAPERSLPRHNLQILLVQIDEGLSAINTNSLPPLAELSVIQAQIQQLPAAVLTLLQQPFVSQLHQAIKHVLLLMDRPIAQPVELPTKTATSLPGQTVAYAREIIQPDVLEKIASVHSPMAQHVLADEVDGVLARMVSNQLLHVQDAHSPLSHWLIEIPIRDRDGIDLWQFNFTRDKRRNMASGSAEDERWQVTLSFNFPHSGPVVAKLTQQYGQLSVRFHAQTVEAHAWLREHGHELEQQLASRGLTNVQVDTQRGLPSDEELPLNQYPLLDESA